MDGLENRVSLERLTLVKTMYVAQVLTTAKRKRAGSVIAEPIYCPLRTPHKSSKAGDCIENFVLRNTFPSSIQIQR